MGSGGDRLHRGQVIDAAEFDLESTARSLRINAIEVFKGNPSNCEARRLYPPEW
jgi:hypothetical protein